MNDAGKLVQVTRDRKTGLIAVKARDMNHVGDYFSTVLTCTNIAFRLVNDYLRVFSLYRVALVESRWQYDGKNRIDNLASIRKYQRGQKVVHYAGAPGTGSITYEIVRIDQDGAWGIIVSNTMRILTEAEVY